MGDGQQLNGEHGIIHFDKLSKEEMHSIREAHYLRSADQQSAYESKHRQYYDLSHYDPKEAQQTSHQSGQKLRRVRDVMRSIFGFKGDEYGFSKFDSLKSPKSRKNRCLTV